MARETINGISVPIPGTGEPADFVGDLRQIATDLSASYAVMVAPPTGVAATDCAAIQTAHDALPSTGGTLRLHGGIYALNPASPLVFTKRVHMEGAGGARTTAFTGAATVLVMDSTTATAITASHGFSARGFLLRNSSATTPTAGFGIDVTGDLATIECDVSGFYVNVRHDGAFGTFGGINNNPVLYCLELLNTAVPDAGDRRLTGWLLTGTRNAQAAVMLRSGGGLKCFGLKINKGGTGRFVHFIEMSLAATTSDLLIDSACSFENCTGSGVYLHQDGASTAQFLNIGIFAQIAPYTAGAKAVEIAPANGTRPFQNIDIDILAHGLDTSIPAIALSNVTNYRADGVFSGFSTTPVTVTSSTNGKAALGTEIKWVPANEFSLTDVGAPTLSHYNRWSSWLMDSASSEYLGAVLAPLSSWGTVAVDLYWMNAGAGAGDVVWGLEVDQKGDGGTTSLAGTAVSTVTATAGATGVLTKTTLTSGVAVTADTFLSLRASRRGANASDTLANDAALVGIMLRKVN